MTMDKLFDGSDAHLLPGNAELIQRLRNGAPSILSGRLCFDAADAIEAADKRIAELEAELQKRAKQIGVACMTHDLTHSLACGRCLTEAERKLAVAREALSAMWLHYKRLVDSGDAGNWTPEDEPVCKQAIDALAQIGSDE